MQRASVANWTPEIQSGGDDKIMQITIILDEKEYVSAADNKADAEKYAEAIYSDINVFASHKLRLKSGGWLVLGEAALKRAAIIIE